MQVLNQIKMRIRQAAPENVYRAIKVDFELSALGIGLRRGEAFEVNNATLAYVELMADLEFDYGITLPHEWNARFRTVGGLASCVRKQRRLKCIRDKARARKERRDLRNLLSS